MSKKVLTQRHRLFLRRILAEYPALEFHESHKSLAEKFDMPASTVAKYLRQLCEFGCVEKHKEQDIFKERNKPVFYYEILKSGKELISALVFDNSHHKVLIEMIRGEGFKSKLKNLYVERLPPEGGGRYSLNTDDCAFLLEVLLGHADEYGVVMGHGRGKLLEIAGFKVSKLQRLTKTLKTLGLISCINPGISGFFGVQPSIYHIALSHHLYGATKQGEGLLTVTVDVEYKGELKLPSAGLISNIEFLKGVDIHKPKGLADFEGRNKKLQKALEGMDKLKTHLSAPKHQSIPYCNDLMVIFSIQLLGGRGELEKFDELCSNPASSESSELMVSILNELKVFLGVTIGVEGNNSDVAESFLPFFLGYLLRVATLLNELSGLGYTELISFNDKITSLYGGKTTSSIVYRTNDEVEKYQSQKYEATISTGLQSNRLGLRLLPNLKGLI
ncbi:MAG: hypothetical protein QNK36_19995 [Colwellia sp.]|nr:hypothetical protein [Colwellia sp.]